VEAINSSVELTQQRSASVSWLTVERAAYMAVGLLAAGLRFYQLGLRPLNEAEAAQALAAFRFTHGAAEAVPSGTLPALFTTNVLGFSLMGASDAIARWLPALAGVILVLLPYALRRRLGRSGALAASFLLAISPSAVYFSRSLDSSIVVAACGLAVVVGFLGFVDTHRPSYLYLAAAALGLGLCAGPGIYTLLAIWIIFALVLALGGRLLHRDIGWSSLVEAGRSLKGDADERRPADERRATDGRRPVGPLAKAGVVLAATFGLVTMTFVLHPAGVGYAADLVGNWAKGFLPEPGGQPPIYPLLVLLRYEPLILILGLVEIGGHAVCHRANERTQATSVASTFPHVAFLTFWAVAATLVIVIAGHRSAGSVLLVVVPMALLAGQGIEGAWAWISRRKLFFQAGVVALIAVGLGVFFYLQVTAFGLSRSASTVSLAGVELYASTTYLLLALLALLLLIGLGAVAWVWGGPQLLTAGGWLATLILLGLFGFKAMWGVNFAHASDPHELMIMQSTTPDVHLFVDLLEALSLQESGDAHTLSFTVDAATGPVVAWYLRDFAKQSIVEGLSTQPQTAAVVTLAAQDLPIGETFRGQGFPLRAHWLPWGLWGQGLVRWLLFTEGSLPVIDQEVVLWVAAGN
jgi:uncharacterized protein (TIGR03663 family)